MTEASASEYPLDRYPLHGADGEVVASPHFPAIERDVLAYWEADDTFQASIDNRGRRRRRVRLLRRPALRQRPAALRAPADRLRQGRRPPLPDDARQARWSAASAGTPTGCPPSSRPSGSSASPTRPRSRRWASRRSTTRAASRCSSTRRSGRSTSPARRAGSTSRTTTRPSTSTYMESVIWAFKQLYDKGLAYEGYRVLPYCWQRRDAAVQPRAAHGRRRLPDAPGPGADGGAAAGRRLGRRVDDADAEQKAALTGASLLIWTTTPWTLPSNLAVAVGPDIDYVGRASPPKGRVRAVSGSCWPRPRLAAYARELRRTIPSVVSRA